MNPFEFVLVILGMVFLFTLMKQRMGVRHRWERPEVEQLVTGDALGVLGP